jgi:sucrose phosphorylase
MIKSKNLPLSIMNTVLEYDQQKKESILTRLNILYDAPVAEDTANRLIQLAESYKAKIPAGRKGWSQKDAMLITYADTILKTGITPLQALDSFLNDRLGSAFSMVHLLPHYPFSGDDGFSVINYRSVREDLGDWNDIKLLTKGGERRLAFDAVINHASQQSKYVKGHCSGDPEYKDFSIVLDKDTDTSSVLRTRNLPLLHPFKTARGEEWLWTTFSADQVDFNFANPKVLIEVTDILLFYAEHGASILRLDAIPYLWKRLGTSCAHLPETHQIIKLWRDLLDIAAPHVLLLTETNVPHKENVLYFGDRGDEAQIIYNFPLPPLLLWSLVSGDASILTSWAKELEYVSEHATYLNLTATHDGIGMRPSEGLLPESARQHLCELAERHGGSITGKTNADGSVSVYELNITFFDAINDPNGNAPLEEQINRFVLSQVIPMALMGIPAGYLPSILGSRNDTEKVKRTGRIRSINRPNLDRDKLDAELADNTSLRAQVLQRLLTYLKRRAWLTAFHPDAQQEILDQGPGLFIVLRESIKDGQRIFACHNVTRQSQQVDLPTGIWQDAFTQSQYSVSLTLPAHGVLWLIQQS